MHPTFQILCTEAALSCLRSIPPETAGEVVNHAMKIATEGHHANERVCIYDGIGIYFNGTRAVVVLITFEDGYPLFNEDSLAKTKLYPMPFHLS